MNDKPKLIPKLRFPEFQNEGEWEFVRGDKLFEPIVNKNHNGDLPILAITQDKGAIPRDMINYNVFVTEKTIKSYKLVEPGDFIISLMSFQGGIEYSNYRGLCSPAYIVLRKKVDLENDFYRYYFKSDYFIRSISKNVQGIRIGKMISYNQFSEVLIPFPSLAEQKEIAACLSSLDALIAAEIKKLELLKKQKKGLLQQLFPQEGEKIPKLRFPEFQNEGEWEEKKLGDIGEFIGGGTPDTKNPKYWNGHIQWFTPSEIKSRYVSKSIRTITDEGLRNSSAKLLPKGAILITTRATIGDAAIAEVECATNQGFQSLIVNKAENNLFWYYWIIRHKMELINRASGSTFPEISKSEIVKIKVLSPKIEEQQEIAACLSCADRLIELQSKKIELLQKEKKGLLQNLFPNINEIEL